MEMLSTDIVMSGDFVPYDVTVTVTVTVVNVGRVQEGLQILQFANTLDN